jgi:ubiquinone/menaquinone biosynthesis C-methylase UbiE
MRRAEMATRGLTLPKWRVRLQEWIVNELVPSNSTNILDVGCGIGYGVVFAAMLGKNVIGVDLSRFQLERATINARQRNVQNLTGFARCSATDLPLTRNSFDCVFCILLVDVFQDPERPLEEMAEVLDQKGKLIIVDLDSTSLSMMTLGKIMQLWDKRSGHPYWLHSPLTIEKTLLKLGLTPVKRQRKHMGLSPPVYAIEARKD